MKEPLFEQVCSWNNLLVAYHNARKCKRYRTSVLAFEHDREDNLKALQEDMRNLSYQVGKYRHFKVFEPKERDISALPFRDRVMQHAIYSVVNPIFDKSFIHGSYACRAGKGVLRAVNRISYLMEKENCTWYLYCDISKYFKNINTLILKKILERKIKEPSLLELMYRVIDSSEDTGIPIGNLLSQMFANIYLNDFDFYVAQHIKPNAEVRYMDDILLCFKTKGDAWRAKEKAERFLSDYLCINLNRKTRIGRLRDGVTYCGFIISQKQKKLKAHTVNKMKKKEKAWENGKMSDEDFLHSIGSSVGRCRGTCSYSQTNDLLLRSLTHALRGTIK